MMYWKEPTELAPSQLRPEALETVPGPYWVPEAKRVAPREARHAPPVVQPKPAVHAFVRHRRHLGGDVPAAHSQLLLVAPGDVRVRT